MNSKVNMKRWELLRLAFSSKDIAELINKEEKQYSSNSDKIGSLLFAVKPNDRNILSVSRAYGQTEIRFMENSVDGKPINGFYYHYVLTDKQHEEFVSALSTVLSEAIVVKGEI